MYEPLKDTKKLIEKLKKVCTAMSKYNLNSPCLLQVIRINGSYEFILSHNPKNGDNFDYYKIFSSVTSDEFYISEEDEKLFIDNDERVSIPIVVSSCDLLNFSSLMSEREIMENFITKNYDMCLDSWYIFPKLMLQAIKEEVILGFEVLNNPIPRKPNQYLFCFNIKFNPIDRFKYTLFVPNNERLDRIFDLKVLPLERKNAVTDILFNLYLDSNVSYVILESKTWEELFEMNKYMSGIKLTGLNNHHLLVYHNDFMQKKIVSGFISKVYDERNIVTLYFDVELSGGVHTYFCYKYYEI
jgi:hypothetical protein